MRMWLGLMLPAVVTGMICALFFKGIWGKILSGAVPWFGLLSLLVYETYFKPVSHADLSTLIIGQIFGGSYLAVISVTAYNVSKKILKN